MTSCRELDNSRSALSASSAFAIATAGANEGTPTKEKYQYRRMSLATTGVWTSLLMGTPFLHGSVARVTATGMRPSLPQGFDAHCRCHGGSFYSSSGELPALGSYPDSLDMKPCFLLFALLILPLVEAGMEPLFQHQLGSAHPGL